MKFRVFLTCAAAAAVIAGSTAQPGQAATAKTAKASHSNVHRARDWTAVVSATPEGGFVMGNPDAKVKLIEYGSMTCPHCGRFDEIAVSDLVDNYVKTGEVSYEFRNYVRDAADVTASLVARCGGTKAFFPMTRALFKEQSAWEQKIGKAPSDELKKIDDLPTEKKFLEVARILGFQHWAAAHGVPVARTTQCLTNEDSVKRLVQMTSDASTQFPDFPGTPTFIINGTMVELGPVTEAEVWPALESKIKAALDEHA